jgi:uncharacterized protein DUF4230
MKNNLLSLLLLVVIGVAAYLVVQTVRSTTQAASAPFQALSEQNQAMQTQVANLLHPTPTIIPDPVTYINDIRALSRLETIQYSVEKVITGETGGGTFQTLFGDKILFVGHGTVIAGIDMEKIQPGDMHYENGVLTVKLPPTEVLVATLDNEKSYVYDRQTGVLTKPDPNLETLVRQRAEEEILKAALEDGILEHAKDNAQAYLIKFFAALGFPNTIFVEDQG